MTALACLCLPDDELLHVELPEGARAGMLIRFTLPDGRVGRATVPAVPEDQHILRLRILPASSASAPPPSDQQQQPQILEGVLEMVRASDAVAAGRAAVRAVSLEPSQSKAERKRKAPLPALHPETQGATAAASALMGLIEAVVSTVDPYCMGCMRRLLWRALRGARAGRIASARAARATKCTWL